MKNKKRWYVVQTKYNQEQTAVDNLLNQRFKVFFPQLIEHKMSRGRPVSTPSAMFSSYVFVQFNIDKDRWRAISGTRGVYQLVTATEERVSPLPVGFIEDLLRSSDKGGVLTAKKAEKIIKIYAPGEEITIKSGLFAGVTGTYVETKSDKITILLSLLSHKKGVVLPIECMSD